MNTRSSLFRLVVRQQPSKARLCSFKEKVDRRPIDPPPIIQLASNNQQDDEYLQNPYFFLYATLTDVRGETDLHFVNGNRTTAGTVVQSLHKLKDHDNTDGGFFIFSDISVRLEGYYRLKFTLYEIQGPLVHRLCSIVSDVFQVHSPKSFPGMSESTFLTRSFSDQGVRIRIRKEPRSSSSSSASSTPGKRRKRQDEHESSDNSPGGRRPSQYQQTPPPPPPHQLYPSSSSSFYNRSPSPSLPESQLIQTYNAPFETRPTLPSPKEIFRPSPMSMQNLLSSSTTDENPVKLKSSLFSTRVLPLPLPSHHVKNEPVDKIKQTNATATTTTTTNSTTTTTSTITTSTPHTPTPTTSNSSSPWLPPPLPSTFPPSNATRRLE